MRPPLTPAVFHILLALVQRDRHGYGVMKQVEADSAGQVRMGPGTLYGSLKRMLQGGLVAEAGRRIDPSMDDERRVYYAITDDGRAALNGEIARYRRLLAVADRPEAGLAPATGA